MSVNWPLRTLSTNLLGKVSAAGDNVSLAWVGAAWVGSWICGHGLLPVDHMVFLLGGVLAHDTVAGCRDGDCCCLDDRVAFVRVAVVLLGWRAVVPDLAVRSPRLPFLCFGIADEQYQWNNSEAGPEDREPALSIPLTNFDSCHVAWRVIQAPPLIIDREGGGPSLRLLTPFKN